jgi:DNA polymerase III subunit epsilon
MTVAWRYLIVSQGNLNNHHLYLTRIREFFPHDVFGGSYAGRAARRYVRIQWENEVVETDIDRTKNIFRKRAWLRRFFDANQVQPGDRVLLEKLGPYVYRLSMAVDGVEISIRDEIRSGLRSACVGV